jgi:SAM-dependent methyltransferase
MPQVKLYSDIHFLLGAIAESDLETVMCPICKSLNMSIIHILTPFRVVLCKDCSLIYLNPRLRESVIRRVYQGKDYFVQGGDTGYRDYLTQENSLRITFRRFLEELRKHGMTSGRLLEVGCGYGYFLDEARNFFSYRAGIELSEEAGSHAQRLSGAEIHIGNVGLLPPEFKNFTIIVIINVIEHIYDPIKFLLFLKQRLLRGGRIVIATPDIGSFWYRIMKGKWPSFKIPEHVAFYTRDTLKFLLKRAGFCYIQQISFPHAFPLGLIANKIGITISGKFSKIPIWLPKIMVAMTAENYHG